jgi:6,7-dimethyl-8-ribityllumazine synthase
MSLEKPIGAGIDGAPFRVGIAAARYNERLVGALLEQTSAALKAAGVKPARIATVRTPGSNELPAAIQLLAARWRFDVLIALGVIVRGDTIHYELIAQASAHALQDIALATHTGVINGIVVAETAAQAEARCLGEINRGAEFAAAALEMAALRRRLQ